MVDNDIKFMEKEIIMEKGYYNIGEREKFRIIHPLT
jgi:hypothetical protein